MTEFYVRELDPQHTKLHLKTLQTPFGERNVYDSVSFCNRCASCQQACPTYCLTAEETFSPRGRNQAVRLVTEGKINLNKNRLLLEKMVNSCLLCGRCTQSCAGKIPTAQHMLEMRRALGKRALPRLLQGLLECRAKKPRLFARVVNLGMWLRSWGVLYVGRKLGLARLPGLSWISYADDILPRGTWRKEQKSWRSQLAASPEKPTLVYMPSLEAEFFTPSLAERVLQLAQAKHRVQVWSNTSAGLFEYVYGDLRQSRKSLRALIQRWERNGALPLLTDSIDVYIFLQQAPQLFAQWPKWKDKTSRLAGKIRFVTDVMPKKASSSAQGKARLDLGSLFTREGEPFESARKILRTQFKKNFVECLYKDADAPAFGYSFVRHNMGQRVLMDAVRSAARTQTGTVFTLSGLSALELNFYLKQFYPYAKADHLARLNG